MSDDPQREQRGARRVLLDKALATRKLDLVLNTCWHYLKPGLCRFFQEKGVPTTQVDDLVQNALLRMTERWERFDGRNFLSWVYRLAHYEYMAFSTNEGRVHQRSEQLDPCLDWMLPRLGTEESIHDEIARQTLVKLSATLSPVNARVFYACYTLGANHQEIADILSATFNKSYSVASVRKRLQRIRDRLSDGVSGGPEEPEEDPE